MWLHWVANLTRINSLKTTVYRWTIVHKLPLAMTVNLEHKPINIIRQMGIVTNLLRSHFLALCSLSSLPIAHNSQLATNHQYKKKIATVWAIVARI
jgi:hypothetical protein